MYTLRTVVSLFSSYRFAPPRTSIVKDVVRAVSAEPAAEYVEETSPKIKSMPTMVGIVGEVATVGNILSEPAGREMFIRAAKV